MLDRSVPSPEQLNYHHLLYFWVVVREGGLAPAGRRLHLSHSTLSAQVRALEDALGEPLLHRVGRSLRTTAAGDVVYRYADEMFALGRDLIAAVANHQARQTTLHVGVVQTVPKTIVRAVVDPVLRLEAGVRLCFHEGEYHAMLTLLAEGRLGLLVADAPVPAGPVRAFAHLLGESSLSVFGRPDLAGRSSRSFPDCLADLPVLMPSRETQAARAIYAWCTRQQLHQNVVAEFDDSALMKHFGADGVGVFWAPTVAADIVCRQFGVVRLGEATDARERFYVVTAERRIQDPAVAAIAATARGNLFASAPDGHGHR